MIVDALLWLPCKVLRHFLQPVTDMLDSLAENADAAVEEFAKENGI